jgi:hypothetical protein
MLSALRSIVLTHLTSSLLTLMHLVPPLMLARPRLLLLLLLLLLTMSAKEAALLEEVAERQCGRCAGQRGGA